MNASTARNRMTQNKYRRLLDLLGSVNGGVVTFRMIYAVVWDGSPPPALESTVHAYAGHLRSAGHGVVWHAGVGLRLDHRLDGRRASEEPRGWHAEVENNRLHKPVDRLVSGSPDGNTHSARASGFRGGDRR